MTRSVMTSVVSLLMHRKVGSFAREQNVDELFVCGELCKNTALGFGERAKIFPDKPSLIHALPFLLKKDDVVLVKASLGSKFAEVSDFLKTDRYKFHDLLSAGKDNFPE